MLCKKAVLKKISKFTKKHLYQKNTCLRPATLLEKRLWHRYFPVEFMKSLRAPIFIEYFRWLLLNLVQIGFQDPFTYYFRASVVPLPLFLSSVFLFLLFPFVSLIFFLLLSESWSSLFQVSLFSFSHFLPSQAKTLFTLFLNKAECSHYISERVFFSLWSYIWPCKIICYS